MLGFYTTLISIVVWTLLALTFFIQMERILLLSLDQKPEKGRIVFDVARSESREFQGAEPLVLTASSQRG